MSVSMAFPGAEEMELKPPPRVANHGQCPPGASWESSRNSPPKWSARSSSPRLVCRLRVLRLSQDKSLAFLRLR